MCSSSTCPFDDLTQLADDLLDRERPRLLAHRQQRLLQLHPLLLRQLGVGAGFAEIGAAGVQLLPQSRSELGDAVGSLFEVAENPPALVEEQDQRDRAELPVL